MCGRFSLLAQRNLLLQQFAVEDREQYDYTPQFNIAPTQDVPVIRQLNGRREMVMMRWGLIPSWAESPGKGPPLINAQSETVAEKPTFRSIIKNRRCLIPANGFYEWESVGKQKQPHYFGLEGFPLFAFAGLWQQWTKADSPILSCTILTTQANSLLARLHDRMPVILSPSDYEVWLNPENQEPQFLEYLYEPFPAEQMTSHLVDPKVNKVANQGPDCIEPIDPPPRQADLF